MPTLDHNCPVISPVGAEDEDALICRLALQWVYQIMYTYIVIVMATTFPILSLRYITSMHAHLVLQESIDVWMYIAAFFFYSALLVRNLFSPSSCFVISPLTRNLFFEGT